MPGILALDPATVIGWAHSEPGAPPTWGHQRLGRVKCETDEIAEALGIFLDARIDTFKPDYIVREDFYIGGGRAKMNPEVIFVLCGIAWQINYTARQRGLELRKYQTSAFIKFFTGQGKFPGSYEQARRAKKRATVARCKLLGWQCTEDEADALALLCYAETKLYPTMRLKMARPAGPLFIEKVS